MKALTVWYEPEEGRREQVGRLAVRDRAILFQYRPEFLGRGLELSPFRLPLRPGVVSGDPACFDGLMGLFDDSLPDGWGRLLIDRRAAKGGLDPARLGPLDRLSLVGARGMGALTYEPDAGLVPPSVVRLPELAADAVAVLADADPGDLDRLVALGGSPQGARPKVLVQVADDGGLVYGDPNAREGCVPFLVKFPARDDSGHAGSLEHAYALMARAAGIDVPETRMLGRTRRHPGYFAIRRFDRLGKRRIHLHTLAGLLHAPHDRPCFTYQGLLAVTRELTRDETCVVQAFRRACFNVFAHNRDDHTRNFAFLMDEQGRWRPSPAYDLTFSAGPGGEHAMLVGSGADPGRRDLEALARISGLRGARVVLDEVREAISRFPEFAGEAGVGRRAASTVARELARLLQA